MTTGYQARAGRTTTTRRRFLTLAGAGLAAGALSHSSGRALAQVTTPATPAASPAASPVAVGPVVVPAPLGDVALPAVAQRVIPLEWTLVEYILSLGVQPVAIADVEGYNAWVEIGIELGPDVADVGLRFEPSLESVAAATPDLILGITDRDEAILEQLASIAPTVLLDSYPTVEGETPRDDIDETLRTIAIALGREGAAEAVIAETDTVVRDGGASIAATGLAGAPFVVIQAYTSENVPSLNLFNDRSLAGSTVSSLGLRNAWTAEGTQEDEPWGLQTVTVEALVDLPAETHVFTIVQATDDIFAGALADDPIWTSLPFVREGRVHPLGGDTWTYGGHLSVQRLVSKVVEAVTGASGAA